MGTEKLVPKASNDQAASRARMSGDKVCNTRRHESDLTCLRLSDIQDNMSGQE